MMIRSAAVKAGATRQGANVVALIVTAILGFVGSRFGLPVDVVEEWRGPLEGAVGVVGMFIFFVVRDTVRPWISAKFHPRDTSEQLPNKPSP